MTVCIKAHNIVIALMQTTKNETLTLHVYAYANLIHESNCYIYPFAKHDSLNYKWDIILAAQ